MAGTALDFWANIEQQYPGIGKLINSVPEIAKILADAAGHNWQSAQLTSAIQSSKWYTNQSDSQRTWQVRKLYNPGEAGQETGQKVAEIMALGGRLGVKLTPDDIHTMADQALGQAWDSNMLAQHMLGFATQKGLQPGVVSSTEDALRKTAADYGMNLSDATAFHWSARIAQGAADQAGFADYVKQHAIAQLPYWKDQLNQGITVRQLADPYLQQAGQLLGMNPDAMKLSDPKWMRALQQHDAHGKPTGPMSLLDWNRTMMSDPAYGYDHTENAKSAALDMRKSLAETFGVSA